MKLMMAGKPLSSDNKADSVRLNGIEDHSKEVSSIDDDDLKKNKKFNGKIHPMSAAQVAQE